MSTSKWAYTPEKCDGQLCVGDCDLCSNAGVITVKMIREAFSTLEKNNITPEWILVPNGKKEWWENMLKEHGITSVKVRTEDELYGRCGDTDAE